MIFPQPPLWCLSSLHSLRCYLSEIYIEVYLKIETSPQLLLSILSSSMCGLLFLNSAYLHLIVFLTLPDTAYPAPPHTITYTQNKPCWDSDLEFLFITQSPMFSIRVDHRLHSTNICWIIPIWFSMCRVSAWFINKAVTRLSDILRKALWTSALGNLVVLQ